MPLSPALIWLLAGIIFLALEAFGISGVGFLFAGLGAFIAGIVVETGVIAEDAALAQFAAFFFATTATAMLLWKPMKRFRMGQGGDQEYSNMIGETAIVKNHALKKGAVGQAAWSGTLMKATLDPAANIEELPAGSEVEIVSVRGTTLTVKPK